MVTIDTRLTNGPTGGPLANPTRNAALTTGSGAGRFRGLRSAASLKPGGAAAPRFLGDPRPYRRSRSALGRGTCRWRITRVRNDPPSLHRPLLGTGRRGFSEPGRLHRSPLSRLSAPLQPRPTHAPGSASRLGVLPAAKHRARPPASRARPGATHVSGPQSGQYAAFTPGCTVAQRMKSRRSSLAVARSSCRRYIMWPLR